MEFLKQWRARRLSRSAELVVLGVAVIAGAGLTGYVGREFLHPSSGKVQGIETSQASVPSGTRYTSQALGISFYYANKQNGDDIAVKEAGDKIYVYDTLGPYTDGQYVEVFRKDPHDSLDQAVTKQVLSGYVAANCPLNHITTSLTKASPAMQAVTLNYNPKKNPDTHSFSGAVPSTCPGQYTSAGGINYFLMDSSHPGTLLFVAAGQYPIMAGTDPSVSQTWHDTLSIL